MTAKTSQKLADALRAAGLLELATRAEHDEFHDFLSRWDDPAMMLDRALVAIARATEDPTQRTAVQAIRIRHHDGEFDADLEESEAWARSEEGIQAMRFMEGEK